LIDEIFAAGDAHFRAKANERMMAVLDNSQIVVVVSHDTAQIRDLCNRAIVLHKGEVLADGTPSEMISYYYREIAKVEEPAA
jgi:ABC-type polysaccharide/polyol phosphate transport system ATPase subunit